MAESWERNNLDQAASPYLRQHKDQAIWWQDWSEAVLTHARQSKKIILASVGYSTCHWCHVMAREAFSDPAIAQFLNEHFIAVKVDREQRPDIDQHLMAFIQASTGQGGWPLNVFLTPDLKPIYALTYAPLEPRYGMPGFLQILQSVLAFYQKTPEKIADFMPAAADQGTFETDELTDELLSRFDEASGGFGGAQKFPPHTTLLFMLYRLAAKEDASLRKMITLTLERMLLGGLHDHLQGGFFRYCVDRDWTIPHFEKMLYDQALTLWTYALAYKVLGDAEYKITAEKVIACLRASFAHQGLFYSGLDADTEHEEGATYVWTLEELSRLLNEHELREFQDLYAVTAEGNFERSNHLLKTKRGHLPDMEAKLLAARKHRPQPGTDTKIITSWNCLAAIGLVHASRFLHQTDYLEDARTIAQNLLAQHQIDGKLYHSSCDGKLQKQEFLQDYASMLLLLTFLQEDTAAYSAEVAAFTEKVLSFRTPEGWIEARNEDFMPVRAESFDHPSPSSMAMAELALARAGVLSGRDEMPCEFRQPFLYDFFNVAALFRNGFFHAITSPVPIAWQALGANSIQTRGAEIRDCFMGQCTSKVPFHVTT